MKAYVKPELYFESFMLSQTVAHCGLFMNSDTNSCRVESSDTGKGIGAFNGGTCDEDKYGFEAYCYTADDEMIKVHTSM